MAYEIFTPKDLTRVYKESYNDRKKVRANQTYFLYYPMY